MKSIKILVMCFCIVLILSHNVFAIGDIFSTGEDWISVGKDEAQHGTTINTEDLKDASDSLYNLLLAIATVAAVIVGAILGLQFMTAGIDRRVQVKESLFPYMVSCIVVFGSLGIWKLVVAIMEKF